MNIYGLLVQLTTYYHPHIDARVSIKYISNYIYYAIALILWEVKHSSIKLKD